MSPALKYKIGDVVGEVHHFTMRLRPRARPLVRPVINPTWFVVATNPKCEEKAREGLEALGYRAFLPMETIWVKIPRHRQKPKCPKKERVERPLFRGYLFLGLDRGIHSFEPAHLTDGVADIIRNNGEYLPVPRGTIESMMKAIETGDHDKTKQEAERLAQLLGQQITIPDGLFLGFLATVMRITKKGVDLEVQSEGQRLKITMGLEVLSSVC